MNKKQNLNNLVIMWMQAFIDLRNKNTLNTEMKFLF